MVSRNCTLSTVPCRERSTASEVTGARERLAIARILKVNHAGEYGAIRIYRGQIWVARRLYPDVVAFLDETLRHEINHCAMFRNAMPQRRARPCRATVLWGNGGLILGFLTALMGREGIWICTAAVEGAVHKHLDDQLFFLRDKDTELHSLIDAIQAEELHHLTYAEERITSRSLWARLLSGFISTATDAVIWLSTWGDSARMARDLAAAREAK
jgi:ubiquinone biosynthesis monooxygenase Coq7